MTIGHFDPLDPMRNGKVLLTPANATQVAGTHYKDMLNYDEHTGVFTWKVRASSRAAPGDVAGWLDKDGYRCVTVLKNKIKCHRLAWWWMHGDWPSGMIDHIQSNNTHGDKGVTFTRGYWKASIQVNKKPINLGHFKNKTDAILAYENAAKTYCGDFYYGGK